MNIRFFEPPPAQKIGGLDAAISSLGAALRQLGHSVSVNAGQPLDSPEMAVHFHGLWQRNFPVLARECRRRGTDKAHPPDPAKPAAVENGAPSKSDVAPAPAKQKENP